MLSNIWKLVFALSPTNLVAPYPAFGDGCVMKDFAPALDEDSAFIGLVSDLDVFGEGESVNI